MRRRGATAAVLLGAVLAACSGGRDDGVERRDVGDADDRRFCQLVEEAPATPDPFEPGLAPEEVERRLDALRERFDEFAAVAPSALAADLEDLGAALDELDAVLAAEGYDFAALAESGPDLSRFDDPRFEGIAGRIADHRAAVCDA